MKPTGRVFVLFSSALYLILTLTASISGQKSEGSSKHISNRLFIHSRSLYVQALDDPKSLATVFRFPIDRPEAVDRIHFPLKSVSNRLGPWMKISGNDIYLLDVTDMGGAQFAVGLQKFSLDDLVRGPGDHLSPIRITSARGLVTKRDGINLDPLRDALYRDILPFSVKTKARKPLTFDKDGKIIDPAESFRVWFDISIPGDGFLYLYIVDQEEFSIWKRDITSFGRPDSGTDEKPQKNHHNAIHISEHWQKSLAIEGIPAEPFWVAQDDSFTTVTTTSGKVYHLQGNTLSNRGASLSTSSPTATGGTVYIDDLDSGEQWSVSLDAAGKALGRSFHLRRESLTLGEFPGKLSIALEKALPLSKIGRTSK